MNPYLSPKTSAANVCWPVRILSAVSGGCLAVCLALAGVAFIRSRRAPEWLCPPESVQNILLNPLLALCKVAESPLWIIGRLTDYSDYVFYPDEGPLMVRDDSIILFWAIGALMVAVGDVIVRRRLRRGRSDRCAA